MMVTLCCYLLKRKYDKSDTSNKLEGKSRVEKVVKSQIKGFKALAVCCCAVCCMFYFPAFHTHRALRTV